MGVEAVAACGGADSQWGKAVRPPARAPRPRGTVLLFHACVTDPRCTVAAAQASDRWLLRRLDVHARLGTASRRGGCAARRCAWEHRCSNTISLSPIQIEFSPKFQTEVLQTLNTKVVKQVALYNNAKGSRVV
jgi:hypothetical protein